MPMTKRTAPGLVATYRIQLREGMDLDAVRQRIPWLRDLGISHIYLSPLFAAAPGSTHGYDVIDPNQVDPVLGGEEAFHDLSNAARAADMGLVLDIVPNHMALTPDNPYVADIMRHGQHSPFAPVFDIDWTQGPLHFAVLDRSPSDLLDAGLISIAGDADRPALRIYNQHYPLRAAVLDAPLADDALDRLLAEQHWSIGHWQETAHAIIHRRFFNVSSLIGVRQEDADVFDLTHRWIVDQVRAGRIQGLRVDHIDGLAQPGAYLHRLRDAVGFIPIWVEKIVKEGEDIPASWPVEGMSGYEFLMPVTQLLTEPDGLQALHQTARGAVPHDISKEVREVRQQLLNTVFKPEVDRVTRAALLALGADENCVPSFRAAVSQLAIHWPVYRAYGSDGLPLGPHLASVLETAKAQRSPSDALGPLFNLLSAPDDPLARTVATRFEQLTGALTAKSEEDTVFFRAVSYLPFCEVGGEPDLEPIDADEFAHRMADRAAHYPCALNTLSTHDTKRSADARAAIVALTYCPALGDKLCRAARGLARERGLSERWGLYAMQTALMMVDQPDRDARLREHIAKAMREAKDASTHESPVPEIEAQVSDLAIALANDLKAGMLWSSDERHAYEHVVETLILAQIAFQITAPGIPDIYQGTEATCVALTDPDNRRPVDWERDAGSRKVERTRQLLRLRRSNRELFAMGSYALEESEQAWTVIRRWQGAKVTIEIERPCRLHPEAQTSVDLIMSQ